MAKPRRLYLWQLLQLPLLLSELWGKKAKNLRFLVDGCHFQGKKKLKKRDERTGSDGHLGCSESYNFMQYKKFTSVHKDGAKNLQGREQMHAILKPL